jgi:phage terminase large subunit-like protein
MPATELVITLPVPHEKQQDFIDSSLKRKVIRAGRRSGKTVGMAIMAVERFLAGRRVLYATPTAEQIDRFWTEISRALADPIEHGVFYKNETKHIIERLGTEQRIRAKTAWNSDTLRGDYADVLILDEWQLMDEAAWSEVGAPMLLDNNGDAVFVYTPPSLHSRSTSKASDPQHAAKLYKRAKADISGRWGVWHFTSHDNPFISAEALAEISQDMTSLAIRQEIMAEDIDEAPGALWKRADIDKNRVIEAPAMERIVVGVDPSATSGGDEAGIITGGRKGDDYYTLSDDSIQGSPQVWATAAVSAYNRSNADLLVAEKNNGGEMVEAVIKQVDPSVNIKLVHASRGKATRAEPIAAIAEQGRDHHVGHFPLLEDEMCQWLPGDISPNRMDAKVWMMTAMLPSKTELMDISSLDW